MTQEGWRARVKRVVMAQLTQGVTPQRIAFTVSLGALLSVFPIFGVTTALCALAAWLLRLNQPLMQLVNALLAPVHILLLYPYYRAGERLLGSEPAPLLDVAELAERFAHSPKQFVLDYGMIAVGGSLVWAISALVAVPLMYVILRPVLESLARGVKAGRQKMRGDGAV
ncbi:MAG TPA: DUF2062 domain-containing protein [Solimonas sp.]